MLKSKVEVEQANFYGTNSLKKIEEGLGSQGSRLFELKYNVARLRNLA